jgi:hypothetical protein
MRTIARTGWIALIFGTVQIGFAVSSGSTQGQTFIEKMKADSRGAVKGLLVRHQPATASDDAIEMLAREIDWLEGYIDRHGSVVAKHPDVWGESRLTKYRAEYERQLAAELSNFQAVDNAAIVRDDIAFLASATGLGFALDGANIPTIAIQQSSVPGAAGTSETSEDIQLTVPSQQVNLSNARVTGNNRITAGINLEPTTRLDQHSRYLNHLHALRRINEGDDTSGSPGYSLNLVRIPVSINPGRETRRGYGAEITITATPYLSDTLLPDTFRSLVVNDLVDQLSLPILKLAENSSLGLAQVPSDFISRQGCNVLLLNSLLRAPQDSSSLPASEILERVYGRGSLSENLHALSETLSSASRYLAAVCEMNLRIPNFDVNASLARVSQLSARIQQTIARNRQLEALEVRIANSASAAEVFEWIQESPGEEGSRILSGINLQDATSAEQQTPEEKRAALNQLQQEVRTVREQTNSIVERQIQEIPLTEIGRIVQELGALLNLPEVSINPIVRRRSSLPIPPVVVEPVLGRERLIAVALKFQETYRGRYVAWNEDPGAPRAHLADVRQFLLANLTSAYDLVASPPYRHAVRQAIDYAGQQGGLAASLQASDIRSIEQARFEFESLLFAQTQGGPSDSTLQQLAWMVVVEMALLNDRLNRDVREISVTRGDCGCQTNTYLSYWLPFPDGSCEGEYDVDFWAASRAFQDYVRCRWPIIVFQVDPVNEEQNVSESSVLARELSVAAAVGLASGRLNFQQANRFARQYREQIDAISLNRTVSGFSHGNDTFGWRFHPRIQTHSPKGTFGALGETLFGRSREANLRDSEIEPGIRECAAILLMPSFVPYCDFDVRSHWYRLDNPRNSELSMHASMKLSRSVRQMQDCAHRCYRCAHLYRDGEVDRLLRRVYQLEQELPLQSMRVQIPYENTLGGFEMFSTGVTDLSPQLVGWYGAPGILLGGDVCRTESEICREQNAATRECAACVPSSTEAKGVGTTVFLVGDNFSVHETRVIAGGAEIPKQHVKLLSREVLQVTVPNCVASVTLDDKRFVAVYLATPYGVTSHMHIPAVRRPISSQAAEIDVLENRVESLERQSRAVTWSWRNPAGFALSHSYDAGDVSSVGISCVELFNTHPFQVYELTSPVNGRRGFIQNSGAGSTADSGMHLAIIARLIDSQGNPLTDSFLLKNFDEGYLRTLSITAVELRDQIAQQFGKVGLTRDRLGYQAETQIFLQSQIARYARVIQNGVEQREWEGHPEPVADWLPITLHRRTAPPASQRCSDAERQQSSQAELVPAAEVQ